jgi:hypothetical protein
VIAEGSYLAAQLPLLFWPSYDELYAVGPRVGGTAASFLNLSLGGLTPQYWYLRR